MEFWSIGVMECCTRQTNECNPLFSITPLLHYSNTPSVYLSDDKKFDGSKMPKHRLMLQRDVPMPLVDVGSLFVAQHSQGLD